MARSDAPKRAGRAEQIRRLRQVEEQLVSGVSPSRIEESLAGAWSVDARTVRRYISEVYERWNDEAAKEAPFRRAKLTRMAERLVTRAIQQGKLGAAMGGLHLLAKLGGAFVHQRPEAQSRLAALGDPPKNDPTLLLIYAQNLIVVQMQNVAEDPTIEPVLKTRLLSDLGAKIGMTHAKALVESKLEKVTKKLLGLNDRSGGTQSAAGVELPSTARGGARKLGERH